MMDHNEFLKLHTATIEKIKASGLKMKWYGSLAYDMAEKEHIALTGQRKYASYNSFMSCRSNNNKGKYKEDDDDCVNDKDIIVPVFKKKRQPVFRRTEWDSKFNWLF